MTKPSLIIQPGVTPTANREERDEKNKASKGNEMMRRKDVEKLVLEALGEAIEALNPIIGEAIVRELDRRELKAYARSWRGRFWAKWDELREWWRLSFVSADEFADVAEDELIDPVEGPGR